jgi:hypothetical protein
MNKKERLALFLGMLCGDGCLSISHDERGQRCYSIYFYNTTRDIILLFRTLLKQLFDIDGKITSRVRKGRVKMRELQKYSKTTVSNLKSLGFPEGVKIDVLRVPEIIKKGRKIEKLLFIYIYGLSITDGNFRRKRGLMFHLGCKLFLEDLSRLFDVFSKKERVIKKFDQGNYKSYQLYLNKQEREQLLKEISIMPVLGSGSPVVLNNY